MTLRNMWVAGRAWMTILATALVSFMATSCGDESGDLTPEGAVGRPIYQVEPHVDNGASLTIVDLSQEFDREPSFTDNEKSTDAWVVIAACASSEVIDGSDVVQLAVMPADLYVNAGLDSEELRGYAESVEC